MADIVQTLIPAGGGDYTLMSVAEATAQGVYGDLVADGNTYTLECYSGTITDVAAWGGWTVNGTNFVTIRAAAGEENNGVWGQGFIMQDSGSDVLSLDQGFMRVYGISCLSTGNSRACSPGNSGDNYLIDGCYFRVDGIEITGSVFGTGVANNSVLRNSVIELKSNVVGPTGTYLDTRVSDVVIESCTFIISDGNSSLNATGTPTGIAFRNCVFYSDLNGAGFTWDASTNNSFKLGCDVTFGANQTVDMTSADFADYANGDYSPAAAGLLAESGIDLSADFTTDIAGALRTVPWTIGAYIVSGAPPIGIQEMYVNIGGTFTKATPSVLVGGVWQPADAYVLISGVWKPIYEQ